MASTLLKPINLRISHVAAARRRAFALPKHTPAVLPAVHSRHAAFRPAHKRIVTCQAASAAAAFEGDASSAPQEPTPSKHPPITWDRQQCACAHRVLRRCVRHAGRTRAKHLLLLVELRRCHSLLFRHAWRIPDSHGHRQAQVRIASRIRRSGPPGITPQRTRAGDYWSTL
jgi:hypothetical protein